jgi:hypothetical protein
METLDQMPDQFTISSTKPVSRRPKRSLGRSAKSALNTARPHPETPTPDTAIAAGATIPIARTTTPPNRPAVSSLELSRTPGDPCIRPHPATPGIQETFTGTDICHPLATPTIAGCCWKQPLTSRRRKSTNSGQNQLTGLGHSRSVQASRRHGRRWRKGSLAGQRRINSTPP